MGVTLGAAAGVVLPTGFGGATTILEPGFMGAFGLGAVTGAVAGFTAALSAAHSSAQGITNSTSSFFIDQIFFLGLSP